MIEVRTKTARMMMMMRMMFGALPLLYLTGAIGGGEETGHQRQTKTLTQDDLTVDDSADRER